MTSTRSVNPVLDPIILQLFEVKEKWYSMSFTARAYVLENLEGGRIHVLKSKAHLEKSKCFTIEQDIKQWIILSSTKLKSKCCI